jgi:hypothetical protein
MHTKDHGCQGSRSCARSHSSLLVQLQSCVVADFGKYGYGIDNYLHTNMYFIDSGAQ